MIKIHIVGGPGSGKTTLGQALSTRFHAPHYDLDQLGWKHGDKLVAYIEDAMAIAAHPAWITEGVFLIWTDPLLDQADYIVVLEVSWPTAAWRIIFRHIAKSLRGVNPYPGINGVRLLFKLLKGTRGYYLNKSPSDTSAAAFIYKQIMEQDDNEATETERLLTRLAKYQRVIPFTHEFVRLYLKKYGEKVIVVKTSSDRERLIKLLAALQEK